MVEGGVPAPVVVEALDELKARLLRRSGVHRLEWPDRSVEVTDADIQRAMLLVKNAHRGMKLGVVFLRREMPRRHVRKVDGLAAICLARDETAALAFAAPLLDDKGPLGGVPLDLAWRAKHRRVCDLAAAVLARSVEGARFDNDDDAARRDAQIAALRERLSKR